jgi:hypothetical protein
MPDGLGQNSQTTNDLLNIGWKAFRGMKRKASKPECSCGARCYRSALWIRIVNEWLAQEGRAGVGEISRYYEVGPGEKRQQRVTHSGTCQPPTKMTVAEVPTEALPDLDLPLQERRPAGLFRLYGALAWPLSRDAAVGEPFRGHA